MKKTVILFYPRVFKQIMHDATNLLLPLSFVMMKKELDKLGFNTVIIDSRLYPDWKKRFKDNIKQSLFYALSVMTGPQIIHALDASEYFRNISKAPIVWGGIHPTLLPHQTLSHPSIDIVIAGEGVDSCVKLAKCLRDDKDLSKIKNMQKCNEGYIYQGGMSIPKKIDYSVIDIKPYSKRPSFLGYGKFPKGRYISVLTSLGCHNTCNFCYHSAIRRPWRSLSEKDTSKMLISLKKMGIDNIVLVDDDPFHDIKRAYNILKTVSGLKIFNVNISLDLLTKIDDDHLAWLKKRGIEQLFIGIESCTPKSCISSSKSLDKNKILKINLRLKKIGMKVMYNFMTGFPGEKKNEKKKNLDLMIKLLNENDYADTIGLSPYFPFPGTILSSRSVLPSNLESWAAAYLEQKISDEVKFSRMIRIKNMGKLLWPLSKSINLRNKFKFYKYQWELNAISQIYKIISR